MYNNDRFNPNIAMSDEYRTAMLAYREAAARWKPNETPAQELARLNATEAQRVRMITAWGNMHGVKKKKGGYWAGVYGIRDLTMITTRRRIPSKLPYDDHGVLLGNKDVTLWTFQPNLSGTTAHTVFEAEIVAAGEELGLDIHIMPYPGWHDPTSDVEPNLPFVVCVPYWTRAQFLERFPEH